MAVTPTAKHRSMRPWLWFVAIGAVVAGITLADLAGGSSAGYRRYVSAPLPDGTRYTFVHPAYMSTVREEVSEASQVSPASPPARRVEVSSRTPPDWVRAWTRSWLPWPKRPWGHVLVYVNPLTNEGSRDSRTSGRWTDAGGMRVGKLLVVDARSKSKFSLLHGGSSSSDPATFARQYEVITKSFRVLPPGAPVPSP